MPIESDFDNLVQQHASVVRLYARQLLGSAEADELTQEAFVRLAGVRERPPAIRAWLLTVVRRLAIDRRRAWFRRRRREARVARDDWFADDPAAAIDARRAAELLQSLPEAQREVVLLRLWAELTWSEIAATCGKGVATVHEHYTRGLDALRQQMGVTHERT